MPKKKENIFVDLTNIIKIDEKKYDWDNSIGATIPFIYNDYSNTLIVKDIFRYTYPSGKTSPFILIECEGKELGSISASNLANGKIGKLIYPLSFQWHYEIGEVLCSENRNMSIINRKFENGRQYYQVKCNICGFDGFRYFSNTTKEYVDEYWTDYSRLKNGTGCPCCHNFAVVEGINDIHTTHHWMCDYFVNKEDTKKYSYHSNVKVLMKCPHCNEIRKYKISDLYRLRYMSCVCNDGVSIPNKIAYYTFKSLGNRISFYCREYSPVWARPFRYDNYLEIDGNKYIVEMDGSLGHGIREFSTNQVDIKGKKNDILKEKYASQHNICLLRVDCHSCDHNDYHTIFNRLIEVIKNNIFQDIDNCILEDEIIKKSISNLTKEVCEFYKYNYKSYNNIELAQKFNIHVDTLRKYLKIGEKYGWCRYIGMYEKIQENKQKVIDFKISNPTMSALKMSKILNISDDTIRKYLKEQGENYGTELCI